MWLPRVKFTTRGMMAAVAVFALDCFLLKTTDGGQGVLLLGIALNIGLFRWYCGRVTNRSFWLGFEVSGWALTLAYVGFLWTEALAGRLPDAIHEWPFYCFELMISQSPEWISGEIQYTVNSAFPNHSPGVWCYAAFWIEVVYGLPMLLLASIGGLIGHRVSIRLYGPLVCPSVTHES